MTQSLRITNIFQNYISLEYDFVLTSSLETCMLSNLCHIETANLMFLAVNLVSKASLCIQCKQKPITRD